jgi:pimeloyl-ACP methyl ester carboxylesterase
MIAILLASDHPERVASLTLLAPAAQFSPPIRAVFALFRRGPASWVMPFIPKNRVGVTDPELSANAPMLRRIPTAIIGDVLDLMDDARRAAREVRAPTFVALGALDATVDNRAIESLARSFRPPPLKILRLAGSSHLLPLDVESERLCKEVGDFIVGQDQLKG